VSVTSCTYVGTRTCRARPARVPRRAQFHVVRHSHLTTLDRPLVVRGDQLSNDSPERLQSSGLRGGLMREPEAPTAVYRAMRNAPDGLPAIGRSGKALGVRLPGADVVDVHPDADGNVHPTHDEKAQGLSVTLNDPRNGRPHHVPIAMGGTARCPMYELAVTSIVAPLELQPDAPNHGVIRPARSMTLGDYDQSLEATRPHWRITDVARFPPLYRRAQ
jgi:hypothetical protein